MDKKPVVKILSIVLISIITLLFSAIFVFMLIFDPNQYKPQISQLVEKNIGRTLTITGDLKLTFFPWLGVEINQVSLGNAKGFEKPEFANISNAQVRVKLLPLLQKRLEIGTVQLEGVTLYLTRNSNGHHNWEDLAALGSNSEKQVAQPLPNVTLSGFELRHAKLVWEDQQRLSHAVLSGINLESSAVVIKQPIAINLSAEVESDLLPFRSQIELSSQVTLDIENNRYRLDALSLTTHLLGSKLPVAMQTVTLKTQLDIDLKQQTLKAEPLTLQVLDTTLNGELQVSNLLTNMNLSGKLQLADWNPQTLFQQLPLPAAVKSIKKIAFDTRVKATLTDLSLDNVHLQVDDNQVNLPQLRVNFPQQTLAADALVLQLWGLNLNASLQVQQLFKQPTVTGELAVVPFNPQVVFKQLGQTLPSLPIPVTFNQVALQTKFSATSDEVRLKELQITIDEQQLNTQVLFKRQQETLSLEQLTVKALGLVLTGTLRAEQVLTEATLQGSLKLAEFNPRQLLQRLGQSVPSTSDDTVLKTLGLETQVSGNLSKVSLDNIKMRLDDSLLQGNISIPDFKTRAVTFNLSLDQFDTDRYLPPKETKTSSSDSQGSKKTVGLPLDYLHSLNVNGILKVGKLKVAKLNLKDINLMVSAKEGQLKVTPNH